jgi:hypothetical protein
MIYHVRMWLKTCFGTLINKHLQPLMLNDEFSITHL